MLVAILETSCVNLSVSSLVNRYTCRPEATTLKVEAPICILCNAPRSGRIFGDQGNTETRKRGHRFSSSRASSVFASFDPAEAASYESAALSGLAERSGIAGGAEGLRGRLAPLLFSVPVSGFGKVVTLLASGIAGAWLAVCESGVAAGVGSD
ncbi:MAG: hypothetical protein RH980_09660, partial [Roseovarius confluentis]